MKNGYKQRTSITTNNQQLMRNFTNLWRATVCLLLVFSTISGSAFAAFDGEGKGAPDNPMAWRITGTVTDANGEPLPGVSVVLQGSTPPVGASTDLNGRFSLSVPETPGTLVVSFIGYVREEASFSGPGEINVSLREDVQALQEVVVTGYSTEERRDVTGAVTTIEPEKMKAVPTGNIEQSLQGRAAGVTVITNGQPGTASVVRVRGFGGFGGNEPLYVVDGVPVANTNFLQPDDIASTTILKDAASASIYGARAANGVIVFTTKKGKKDGKVRISYDGLTGVTMPGSVNNVVTPQEQADLTWLAIRNTARQLGTEPDFNHPQYGDGQSPVLPDYLMVGGESGVIGTVNLEEHRDLYNIDPSRGSAYQVIRANKAGTNWYDEITRPAPINRHTLSFAGGSDNSAFYISLGLQDQDGILLNQNMKRYSFRANSSFDISDRFRIGENIQATYYSVTGLLGGSGGRGAAGSETVFNEAYRMSPIIPVYDEFGGYAGTAAKGFNNPRNPVANRHRQGDNNNYSLQTFGNIFAELDVVEGLKLRSSLGGGLSNFYYYYYNQPQYENSENNTTYTYGEGSGTNINWTFTNTASYENTFDRHRISLLAGVEALNTGTSRNIGGSGREPFSRDVNYVTLTNTQIDGRVVNSSYDRGSNFFSIFGQAKYTFDDKYIFNGVLRRDGSSRFGAENRYGIFPAGSVAWRISEEGFMDGLSWVYDLKIRGGYGQMGNSNNVDPYNQFSLFASSLSRAAYDISGTNNSVQEGFYRSRIGNPAARWETSTTMNAGIDGTFFDGKLDIVFDAWRKDTEDLLYALPVPAVVGSLAASPSINIAEMRNEGLDLMVTTRSEIAGLGIETTITGSYLHNEIIALAPGTEYFDAGGTRIGNVIRNQVGRPISSFFGYQVEGLFQSQAEVDAAPTQAGAGVGRFRFADIDGDGEITPEDRTYLGDPVPDFSGGLNLRLTYGNFDLETFMGVFLGVQNYNFSKWFTDFYPSFTGAAIGVNVRDAYSFDGGGNTVPIYENVSNFSTNTQSNSYYVENGNYARLMNLQIGYNLPGGLVSRLRVDRARIYVQGTNLFTITNYSGIDPGVSGAADTSLGIDIGNPPVTRGFNLGVSLGF
jgi:TonB-linked SusC/RagA family outer membrane protein